MMLCPLLTTFQELKGWLALAPSSGVALTMDCRGALLDQSLFG
jgi:hypothetical protein